MGNDPVSIADLFGLIGYKTTEGPRRHEGKYGGGFRWVVRWTLSEEEIELIESACPNEDVHIIQLILYERDYSPGNSFGDRPRKYWEAFSILSASPNR